MDISNLRLNNLHCRTYNKFNVIETYTLSEDTIDEAHIYYTFQFSACDRDQPSVAHKHIDIGEYQIFPWWKHVVDNEITHKHLNPIYIGPSIINIVTSHKLPLPVEIKQSDLNWEDIFVPSKCLKGLLSCKVKHLSGSHIFAAEAQVQHIITTQLHNSLHDTPYTVYYDFGMVRLCNKKFDVDSQHPSMYNHTYDEHQNILNCISSAACKLYKLFISK